MFEPFIVSAHSIASKRGDPIGNLLRIEEGCRSAVAKGSRMAVFPELSVSGYWLSEEAGAVAETLEGDSVGALSRISTECGLIVCAGLIERRGNDLYNTQVFVGGGRLLGHQSKTHVTPRTEELYYRSETDYRVIETELCPLACAICYDNHFPETSLIAKALGACLLVQPYCCGRWSPDWMREDFLNQIEYRVRCRDTGMFAIGANQCGQRDERGDYGSWCYIIDPFGEYVARTDPGTIGDHMVVAEISPEVVRRRMERLPAQYRRWDDFKLLSPE